MSDRAETILATADALYGSITMPVIASLFPGVSPSRLRHLMHSLVARGALVPAWAGGTGQRVWLTTRNPAGRVAGLRKWLADPEAVRSALAAKSAGTVQPPVTFAHAQIAGEVVCGFGTHGRRFDSELHAEGGAQVADGEAWPARDWRLRIEVERMVRQGPRRWLRSDGLVEKIVGQFLVDGGDGVLIQHLIVAPKFGMERVDLERELDRLVTHKALSIPGLPRASGFWFLPLDRVDSDPVWHPAFSGAAFSDSLPGIAARRAAFDDDRVKNSALDRDRKLHAASKNADIALLDVTALPAAASHSGMAPSSR